LSSAAARASGARRPRSLRLGRRHPRRAPARAGLAVHCAVLRAM